MRNAIVSLLVLLLLSACVSPATQPTPSEDEIATRVSLILTAMPTATMLPTLPQPTQEPKSPEATSTLEATQVPPTATAEPSPTLAPSPTFTQPVPSKTPPASDPRAQLGKATWVDTFNNGNNWLLGADAYTDAEVKDGSLVFKALSATDGWRITWPQIENDYLEMEANSGTCSGADEYGLMIHISTDQKEPHRGYLFAFTCNGRYSLRMWDSKNMTWLVKPTDSSAINSGKDQTNRMGILINGNQMALYANGVLLKEVSDSTYTGKGRFGIFIAGRESKEFTIRVNEIAYWKNP